MQTLRYLSSSRDGLMLILQQAGRRLRSPRRMDSYLLAIAALCLSIPFGVLSAQVLQKWLSNQSWLAGLFLGSSLFTYTILLAQLIKRQPPFFLRNFLIRKELCPPLSIAEISGLKLDYVGAKDPQDLVDGIVHNRAGELQRVIRCSLAHRFTFSCQSLMLETLFSNLSSFENARFQLIFPESDLGRRSEMFVVVSYRLARAGQSGPSQTDIPPLTQMQELVDSLLERLITLGIAPRLMNSVEVRQLISSELGSCANKTQLHRDWRNVGNLGWEPSFRDIVLRPSERFMQVADKRSLSIAAEQLPANGNFEWLAAVLDDIPFAHVSMFISPWSAADPLSKMQMNKKLRNSKVRESSRSKTGLDANHKAANAQARAIEPAANTAPAAEWADKSTGSSRAIAAQMSFFFRFDGRDAYQLESEVATARRYFSALGVNAGTLQCHRQQQLQNWRATLPCAQEQTSHKHLVAFVAQRQQD